MVDEALALLGERTLTPKRIVAKIKKMKRVHFFNDNLITPFCYSILAIASNTKNGAYMLIINPIGYLWHKRIVRESNWYLIKKY